MVRAALSEGVSFRPARHRDAALALVADPQSRHPVDAAGSQRQGLSVDLEPGPTRAHWRRSRARRRKSSQPGSPPAARRRRRPIRPIGRCATAIQHRASVDRLADAGCDRMLVLPLYPQYAAATTATRRRCGFCRAGTDARSAGPAHRAALSGRSRLHRGAARNRIAKFAPRSVSSPTCCSSPSTAFRRAYADKGDPYPHQCEETFRLLCAAARPMT